MDILTFLGNIDLERIRQWFETVQAMWAIYGATIIAIAIPLIKVLSSMSKKNMSYKEELDTLHTDNDYNKRELIELRAEVKELITAVKYTQSETRALITGKIDKDIEDRKKDIESKTIKLNDTITKAKKVVKSIDELLG